MSAMEPVSFLTDDGVEISATYDAPPTPVGAVLLLHMMPAVKESWLPFMKALAERGFASLAIDLRGHGGSVKKGDETLDYTQFEDDEHYAKRLDVEAAVRWLSAVERFPSGKLAVCGASIGANLAVWALTRWPGVRAAVALSPGLNYRGLIPEGYFPTMLATQSVLMAVSEEDAYAFESVREFGKMKTAASVETRVFKGLGHGTTMFEREPALMGETADWISKKI